MLMDGEECWRYKSTHGVPLDVLLDELLANNIYPTWDKFLLAAKKDGCNMKKLLQNIKECMDKIYPNKEEMILKIEKLYEKMSKDGSL